MECITGIVGWSTLHVSMMEYISGRGCTFQAGGSSLYFRLDGVHYRYDGTFLVGWSTLQVEGSTLQLVIGWSTL